MFSRTGWIVAAGWVFGAAAASLTGGCGKATGAHRASTPIGPPVAVRVATVQAQPFAVLHRASATLRGRNTAIVTSKTMGYVKRLLVRVGARVRAGQLLVVLEARELEAAVQRARAALRAAEQSQVEAVNAVNAANANLSLARLSYERARRLLAADAVAPEVYDQRAAQHRARLAQREMAEARRKASAARIEQARAEVAQAEANLAYTRVTAPFRGRVIEQRLDPGNLAAPGTPLLVVEQDGRFRAEATVEESLVGRLRKGGRTRVRIDALRRVVEGRISEIVPSVDVGSRAFVVKVDLPKTLRGAGVQAGIYARVSFPLGTRERTAIPASAVLRWGQLDRVFVVADGRAQARFVTLGERQAGLVEVLSGLDRGERVIVAPKRDLRDGLAVTPQVQPPPEKPAVGARTARRKTRR